MGVADVLDDTAESLTASPSDLVWFGVDAAVDEAIEAIDGEPEGPRLCDEAGAAVPRARALLRASDLDGARTALRATATTLRAALAE